MELFMLCFALFLFFFGSVIAIKVIEAGLQVGDRAAATVGKILLWPFACLYRILRVKTEVYRVRFLSEEPVPESPRFKIERQPVLIEHERTLNLLESLKAKALPRKK